MNNNKNILELNKIPKRIFIPVNKTKDIIKVRPLNSEEKHRLKPGSPDIKAEPFVGRAGLMKRSDLIKLFTYTSGKRIHLYGWQSDKQYIVYRNTKSQAFAMRIPAGVIIDVNGKPAGNTQHNGPYIVCLPDAEGNPDYSTASVISAKLFRKMFSIPRSDELKNLLNHERPVKTANINIDKPDQEEDNQGRIRTNQTIVNNQVGNNNQAKVSNNAIKYKIVKQILNQCGQRIGFLVIASNRKQLELPTDAVTKLCYQKLVVNAEVVNRNGKVFLRGNNTVLDDLPIIYK